jgi:hypothetical protein
MLPGTARKAIGIVVAEAVGDTLLRSLTPLAGVMVLLLTMLFVGVAVSMLAEGKASATGSAFRVGFATKLDSGDFGS